MKPYLSRVLVSYKETPGRFELEWRTTRVSQVHLHTINGQPSYISVPHDDTEREVHLYNNEEERQKILQIVEENKA